MEVNRLGTTRHLHIVDSIERIDACDLAGINLINAAGKLGAKCRIEFCVGLLGIEGAQQMSMQGKHFLWRKRVDFSNDFLCGCLHGFMIPPGYWGSRGVHSCPKRWRV